MTIETLNEVLIRRAGKLLVPDGTSLSINPSPSDDQQLVALLRNIESLGYTLAPDVLRAVRLLSAAQLQEFYMGLIAALRVHVGAHVRYRPMYPNFPHQVAESTDAELYINAYMHYFGDWLGVRVMPDYDKQIRDKLDEPLAYTVLHLGTMDELDTIFTNLVSGKSSLSESSCADVRLLVSHYGGEVMQHMPEEIPNKENVATVAHALLTIANVPATAVAPYFRTATDVLRLAAALSDGDVSLALPGKFVSFPRPRRRMILDMLENCNELTEDMLRYAERWKRLGERLHIGEYTARYPKTAAAFSVIRNDEPYSTFGRRVEAAIHDRDVQALLSLLAGRPGELARRIDLLLRLADDPQPVLAAFEHAAPQVASPVLLQLVTHFRHRNDGARLRAFFPKGDVAKVRAVDNTLPKLPTEICQSVVVIAEKALVARYAALPPLGNVYVDPALKDYMVPLTLRSAQRSLRTVGRGSRLPLGDGDTIRFFIWWTDGRTRTDIDLSSLGLDVDSCFKMQIAYYNLRDVGGYHSGDITSAPEGASEFIDISIGAARKAGVRYVVASVNSFTQQPFYELPECFAGFMIRQRPQSGEVYEPRTVRNKIDVTADTRICIPFIIDLEARQVIWTDLSLRNFPAYSNNVYNNMSAMTILNKAMTTLAKPNLYDLFVLHAHARGRLVSRPGDAKTVFATDQGITPFESERIVGEFL